MTTWWYASTCSRVQGAPRSAAGTATRSKVKVGAPPQGGRANDAVVALLAEILGVPVAAVTIVGGATSRSKRLKVTGVTAADVERRLELAMAGNAGGGRGVVRPTP